ncbi:hypothetical protein BT96DRAFT_917850 [Gymnopus androsaceus JB14]|uniref:G domain-containing protein n=1 Tax=Gymnopus androsaceus JB14 TaxID=1447944 RepID=A0A6A4I123_9AGAR|nr:hypothetical protein BT96DRAFT_917850 [Gymnopus androsaceus JB14]
MVKKAQPSKLPNLVVFGSTGSGKSSVVNMLIQEPNAKRADISSGAVGCTFQSTPYDTHIGDKAYKLWDTTGLDEGMEGKVVSEKALHNLCVLIQQLSRDKSGVSLLVFVMRGPRITEAVTNNYHTFYNGFCEKKVPVVIVITGMENEEDMDSWWDDNKRAFEKQDMQFQGTACITAIRGRKEANYPHGIHAAAYEQSIRKVRELIITNCAEKGWNKKPESWAITCWKWTRKAFKALKPYNANKAAKEVKGAVWGVEDAAGSETTIDSDVDSDVWTGKAFKPSNASKVTKGVKGVAKRAEETITDSDVE